MTSPGASSPKETPGDSSSQTIIRAGGKNRINRQSKVRAGESQKGCLVCSSEDVWTFVEINGVPVHANVLLSSRDEALRAPKGDLELQCCGDCGHVFNAAFEPEKIEYTSDYENSLFFSKTYRDYAASIATTLIEQFGLNGKTVVEIGCGAGDFLKLLCEQGGNDGIGFDPSALAGRSIDRHPRISFVRDYYSAKYADIEADFLCCRQVLEHIESPVRFLRDILEALPRGRKIKLFIEVPDVMFMLKEHSSWDFIYEHCSYFSMSSLYRLFSKCGFSVQKIWRTFHEQFLCICGNLEIGGIIENGTASELDKKDVLFNAKTFAKVFQDQVQVWDQMLQSFEKSKAKVVLWGAGSKGVMFLNILQGKNSIEYIVDINEQKCGKFIPGTGQKIVSPEFLKGYSPDVVILMNPAYELEVRKAISNMKLAPRILLVNQPAGEG